MSNDEILRIPGKQIITPDQDYEAMELFYNFKAGKGSLKVGTADRNSVIDIPLSSDFKNQLPPDLLSQIKQNSPDLIQAQVIRP